MIIVCPLSKVQPLVDQHGVRDVVSLLGPDTPHRHFDGIATDRHLRLTFHDIVEPVDGFTAPRAADTRRMVGFLSERNRRTPLLIHCWAGISRSTAAAFTALCLFNPGADEEELAFDLRAASPSATPNRLIVALADAELGRCGRMVRAIDRIGRGADAFEGEPFFLQA
ncbi:MAG: tyrosine protein phosphatase [Rhizobiales bacterium]|nr:tyrosine protein phosphatase [Hyphomicrobiales bacterium]MBI3674665.1 tyrosine protein phosphatase [Hyphomicrobiales bacterium]